jgi:hypothetical protein
VPGAVNPIRSPLLRQRIDYRMSKETPSDTKVVAPRNDLKKQPIFVKATIADQNQRPGYKRQWMHASNGKHPNFWQKYAKRKIDRLRDAAKTARLKNGDKETVRSGGGTAVYQARVETGFSGTPQELLEKGA